LIRLLVFFQWEKALVESIPLFLHGVRDDNQDIESIAVEMLRMRNGNNCVQLNKKFFY